MKKNMGQLDKIIRQVVAVIIAVLYLTNVITGTLGIVLLVFAIVFAVTSFLNFCPLYTVFGMSTCKTKED